MRSIARRLALVGALALGACSNKEGAAPNDAAVDADELCSDPSQPGVKICCGSPGERPGITCLEPEMTGALCTKAGDTTDSRRGRPCCGGLRRLRYTVVLATPMRDGGVCEDLTGGATSICAACGDGTCADGEDLCNCPDDCS